MSFKDCDCLYSFIFGKKPPLEPVKQLKDEELEQIRNDKNTIVGSCEGTLGEYDGQLKQLSLDFDHVMMA